MIEPDTRDPITSNPLSTLGLSGEALSKRGYNEVISLARSVGRAIRRVAHSKPEEVPPAVLKRVNEALSLLNDDHYARQCYSHLRGKSSDALNLATHELAANARKRAKNCENASFAYLIDSRRKPSLANATRLSPSQIKVLDVVSLLQSPVREDTPIARKLFTKTIESLGEGVIKGGQPLPHAPEDSRRILGVLRVSTPHAPITSDTVRNLLISTGLINASHLCIEHYNLSDAPGERTKVAYPQAAHKVFSHFHPLEAVERILWCDINKGAGEAQLRAVINPTDKFHCNILLSKVITGSTEMICVEGIVMDITANESQGRARSNPRKRAVQREEAPKKGAPRAQSPGKRTQS